MAGVPENFIRAVVAGARRSKLDLAQLITTPTPAAEECFRLLRELSRELNDDLCGLAPWRVPRGAFATMSMNAVHGGDLESALRRFCRFYRLFPGLPGLRLTRHDRLATFSIDVGAEAGQLLIETGLFVVSQFSGWLIGRPLRPHSIEFPRTARLAGPDSRLLPGVPKLFLRDRACLTFAADALDAPVIRTERDLRVLLAGAPASLLMPFGNRPTLTSQVQAALRRGLPDELPSAEELAARLGMSPPTFRRRLHQEGTGYVTIRDELLCDLAMTALSEQGQTVRQVAARLGYSEPRAFRRAFRRWTGTSPNDFRPTALRPTG
ncbi:AraC family transcriptional regulator [Amycolatopsis nigrescens]|uniref:AraC family transcriptional regulator n=1 Tax=Amycolatopsis nigrescens TaxID=381445 RepID=UPI0003633A7E|nr:AraC family transcriptional regulator [Amycolatopsis nigrescens]